VHEPIDDEEPTSPHRLLPEAFFCSISEFGFRFPGSKRSHFIVNLNQTYVRCHRRVVIPLAGAAALDSSRCVFPHPITFIQRGRAFVHLQILFRAPPHTHDMFDMLRPSRRNVHERLSQNEDSDVAAATASTGAVVVVVGRSDGNNYTIETNAETRGTAEAAPGGGESSLLPSVAVSSSSSSSPVVAEDGSNNSGTTTGLRTSSSSSMSFNSLIVPNGDGGHYHNANNSDDDVDVDDNMFDSVHSTTSSHPYLSAQIERERFIRYRRQSTCTLLVLLFLIRLWIEALLTKDIGLVFLSMMGTLWTYRWLANRTVDEEEYDRQIMLDLERHQGGAAGAQGGSVREGGIANAGGGGSSGRDAAINFDPDLGLMSFQAQLALAILESQRQMFENGGYNATTINTHNGPGVTTEAKEKWKTFDWGSSGATTNDDFASLTQSITRQGSDRSNNYGSLADDEKDAYDDIDLALSKKLDVEEPSCSICLCEYDRGEKVVRLPCEHMYHESCLASWTTHHTRCPLCNYDLMDGYEQPASVVTQQQAQQHAEEQRAFRNMALSALGRRIRPRNRILTTSSSRRRGTSSTTAADMAAASNDSIV